MIMAKWGKRKWYVNKSKIKALEALSYSLEYDIEKKKLNKRSLSLDFTIYREFGIVVKNELAAWQKVVGKTNALYVGKKKLLPCKLKLKSVSVSDIKLTESGIIRSAKISASFVEP